MRGGSTAAQADSQAELQHVACSLHRDMPQTGELLNNSGRSHHCCCMHTFHMTKLAFCLLVLLQPLLFLISNPENT